LKGAQDDCLISLIRRVRGLEEDQKAHTKDIVKLQEYQNTFNKYFFQTDHQRIEDVEKSLKDLKTKLKGV
jgi:hypothetical protein